jgi:hypothetical protein
MSDTASAQERPGGHPRSEPEVPDDDQEAAALMRAVLRAQEVHREGGVDPELAGPRADPGPDGPALGLPADA